MSKYNALWAYIQKQGSPTLTLSFDDIRNITKIPIDHSFLNFKQELTAYGYAVKTISLKEQTVIFEKLS